jgi:hypothetical protein
MSLPPTTTISHAAALAGRSRASFRRHFLHSGIVATCTTPGGREQVVVTSLQQALGRAITAQEWIAADNTLQPTRTYQAEYRQRRDTLRGEGKVTRGVAA